jgi:hypothetical protein
VQPLLVTLIVCAAAVVIHPPLALAIFAIGAIVTGWAAWGKARARRRNASGHDRNASGSPRIDRQ